LPAHAVAKLHRGRNFRLPKQAYRLWGGGRELSREEMGAFLDDLAALIREV